MTFIITLITLVAERFFHWGYLRNWRWFAKYQRWLSTTRVSNWSSALTLLVCILPAVLIVGLINAMLSNWLYGILKLIFGVLVLMYCLGPKNLWMDAYACMGEFNKEDPKTAIEKINTAFHIGSPENSQAFHRAWVHAILLAAYNRVFAVVFWFIALGPVGAVLYRTLTLISKDSPLGNYHAALSVTRVLDWIPSRIFSFIFALAGHFTSTFQCWKRNVVSGLAQNETLVMQCGVEALAVSNNNQLPETGEAEKEAMSLLDRVFIMTLVILAVGVLLV